MQQNTLRFFLLAVFCTFQFSCGKPEDAPKVEVEPAAVSLLDSIPKLPAAFYYSCDDGTEGASQSTLRSIVHSNSDVMLMDQECVDLGVGESKVLDLDWWQSPSFLKMKYKLTRTDESTYEVKMNIRFESVCTSTYFEEQKLSEQWKTEVQKCYDFASPYLLGPNGEHVKLVLEKTDEYSGAPEMTVQVTGTFGYRENSETYFANSDCQTLIHEALHNLGLVDEYKETEYDYPCRILGPDDSIMTSPWTAFENVANGSSKSLLKPAHFAWITHPFCGRSAQVYTECAKDAYSSTGNCSSADSFPEECSAGNTNWINQIY